MPGKISFTICPARGGKSTFVRSWLKEPDPDGLNRASLCRDDFRLVFYGERFNGKREVEMHAVFDVAVKALHSTGYYNLMLDETNISIKSIRNAFKLDIEATPHFINTPYEVCIARAYATNQPDLAEGGVIKRMFDNLVVLCNYQRLSFTHIKDYKEITENLVYGAVNRIREEVRNA